MLLVGSSASPIALTYLSYKEIGRVTEESVGNVGWLIHTGLKKLREGLGSEEWKGIEA